MPHAAQRATNVRDFTPPGLPPIPDLAGLQKTSFEEFLQPDSRERSDQGLERLLARAFRARSDLDYLGYDLAPSEPDPAAARRCGGSYAARLQVRVRSAERGECLLDAGRVPLMTERGTFIVDGAEKVVVGRLQADEDTRENDLTTRRLLLVGEQLEAALAEAVQTDVASLMCAEESAFCELRTAFATFFTRSVFVKNAEMRNPLTLASQLRRVVQTGVGRTPGYQARCTHPTHFGRLGLLETPEGDRIGINLTTAILAEINEQGRLCTPFAESATPGRSVTLAPDEDARYAIGDLADASARARYAGGVLARVDSDLHRVDPEDVDLTPVHPQQALGISAALIPFLAHDDANRGLMGANMQKQAMPLQNPEAPLIQTGLERQVVRDMGADTDWGSDNGVLALGRNLLTAFLCWEGYNYEDGIVVSDEVIAKGFLDTTRVREFTALVREHDSQSLVAGRLVSEGTAVTGRDLLIGRWKTGEDGEIHDTSIRMPRGLTGTVTRVEHVRAEDSAGLDTGVREFVRVRVESDRALRVGDKLSTRHGAKGVVTRIVPAADMPVLPDGRHVQVLMNPLGVPSRMNIGALLETHLGLAADALGTTVITPGFCGASAADITAMLAEAGLPESGMLRLRDGRTGRPLDQDTTVGFLYFLRLDHMVEDKRQERCIGPYDPETCQPVAGRRNGGGQRLGIMETWALQAYGASHILREMLTLKSDDVAARNVAYDALVDDAPLPEPTVPESVKRLVLQLRGLGLDLQLLDATGDAIAVFEPRSSTAGAVAACLRFADAGSILSWSEGEVTDVAGIGAAAGHIALATPVQHSWRKLAPELAAEMPALTVLPVIPPGLRGCAALNAAYAAVLDANETCRRQGGAAAATAGLQSAVDALLDRMTRRLYGKRGWITTALSGKTVDYSARSVIAPGPDLDYDTCSLPLVMAATLFEPLAVGELLRSGAAGTREQAKHLLAERTEAAVAALSKVAGDRCAILHRAPTLHRPSMQAFRVTLADEDVIRVHPLTQIAFNADFDGDEMDVYLPLGPEAQREARERMASSRSQLGPAHGHSIAGPSQDMVFGCYYATCTTAEDAGPAQAFESVQELAARYDSGSVGIHAPVLLDGRRTTVGRALFRSLLPPELDWVEGPTTKQTLWQLLEKTWHERGADAATRLADRLMRFGFHHATLSGLSIGKDTLRQVSTCDKRLNAAWHRAERIISAAAGTRDHESACSELAAHWTAVVRGMMDAALRELAEDHGGLNSLHLMLASRARGSQAQVRQHIAMRGLMARPDNRIMRSPIATNFLKGHTPLEYFASTFGARRGLADTAMKTADVGYQFKRIVSGVQDVVVVNQDCGCTEGMLKTACRDDTREWLSLPERITGRTLAKAVVSPETGAALFPAGHLIVPADTKRLQAAGVTELRVRSPVTCRAQGGVCAVCAGLDLTTWRPPNIGQAVGITAAQSIGEPATQLTMRTFHVAMLPKCEPATRKSVRGDILGGFPRLSQLLEAWTGRHAGDGAEREQVEALLRNEGPEAAADYLLVALQKVYRAQGVRIDDRHFEIVLAQMLGNGLRGIADVAAEDESFLVSGTAYGGTPALARGAARATRVQLDTVRAATAFAKLLPVSSEPR